MLKNYSIYSILFALSQLLGHFKKHNNYNITINNPILFDASCSGIQTLSAITEIILSDKVIYFFL